MTKKFLDLSGKIDQYIPVLDDIIEVTNLLGIRFFVIGAVGRDLILEHGHGLPTGIATYDLDLGIQIEDWEKFHILSEALLKTGRFSSKGAHTFLYKDKLQIDIIPFGQIENDEKEIIWPPENDTSMNVLGFADAYENSLTVRLRVAPPLEIKVVSLPGLFILKLISWKERGAKNNRDARDLAFLLENYHQAGNFDRLYQEDYDIMEELNHNIREAGARLLGRDVAAIVKPETREVIYRILEEEINKDGQLNLVTDIRRSRHSFDDDFDTYLTLLNEFNKGFTEAPE